MLEDASFARNGQSDLFASASANAEGETPHAAEPDALREALDAVTPDELTPREALELLYRLKRL
jgi:DNA mismatch repair protein MutS